MEQLYDIREWVRRGLGSLRTVERMVAEGAIPRPIRIGRNRRWTGEQIDQWIRAQAEQQIGEPTSPIGRPRRRG
jgi:predicted DNA-binding transcriptional regulator AlpA